MTALARGLPSTASLAPDLPFERHNAGLVSTERTTQAGCPRREAAVPGLEEEEPPGGGCARALARREEEFSSSQGPCFTRMGPC